MRDEPPQHPGRTHAMAAEPPPRRPTRSLPTPPWFRGLLALLVMGLVVLLVVWALS
jgi:hypothetical protein